jgi:hypothetical protein
MVELWLRESEIEDEVAEATEDPPDMTLNPIAIGCYQRTARKTNIRRSHTAGQPPQWPLHGDAGWRHFGLNTKLRYHPDVSAAANVDTAY